MKVYKCIITGDELFTDTYPIEKKGGIYRIKGKYVTRSEKVDDSKLGANPSAEEAGEGTDAATESGVNLVLDNRLQPTGFGNKKEYIAYFKDFVKKLEEYWKSVKPDLDVEAWRAEIQGTFKEVVADFKEFEFFTGASQNPDGNIALVKWEVPEGETDEVPYVYFYVEGLLEEKC